MKLNLITTVAATLVLSTGIAKANSWRQDIGHYEGQGIWMGETYTAYTDMASGAKTVKNYLRSTFSTQMTEKTEASLAFEITSFKMDGFSEGNAKDGKGQTAISEVELGFSTKWMKSGFHTVSLNYGASFPGSEYENQSFDAPGVGVPVYKIGVGWDYTTESMVGLNASLSYWLKPGELKAGKGNSDGSPGAVLDMPDMVVATLGVPVYFGSNVVSLDLTHKASTGGVDIGDADFMAYAMASNGRLPFPATKENITSVQLSYVKYFGEKSVDVSFSQQVAGRNTDKGVGLNVGYQTEF